MAAILEMPQYVAYQKNVVYAFIKLSAKSHSFNILRTTDGLSCPTICEFVMFAVWPWYERCVRILSDMVIGVCSPVEFYRMQRIFFVIFSYL